MESSVVDSSWGKLSFRTGPSASISSAVLASDVPESFLSHLSHKSFDSESSQSHLQFFRIESESSHDLIESEWSHDLVELNQSRVTKAVEPLPSHCVACLSQCRDKRNFTFFPRILYAMKSFPTCFEMAPDQLEIGAQHAMKLRPIS